LFACGLRTEEGCEGRDAPEDAAGDHFISRLAFVRFPFTFDLDVGPAMVLSQPGITARDVGSDGAEVACEDD